MPHIISFLLATTTPSKLTPSQIGEPPHVAVATRRVPLRYNFAPPVKYNFLNDEEAEERFEKRHKTLNYFSIMMSKRIKEKTEDDSDPLTSTVRGREREGEADKQRERETEYKGMKFLL